MWGTSEIQQFLVKYVAEPISRHWRLGVLPLYSIAQTFLELLSSRVAEDISELKELGLQHKRAEADKSTAEALKAVAEAQEAANKAAASKARLRSEQRIANAKAVEAEAQSVVTVFEVIASAVAKSDSEAISQAKERVAGAISTIVQKGGCVAFDRKQVQAMIDVVQAAAANNAAAAAHIQNPGVPDQSATA